MARFNHLTVEIPSEAVVSSGRVYIVTKSRYLKDRQYHNDSRLTIGWVNDPSLKTMNPNSNYAARYPGEFAKASKESLIPVTKRCGMYMFSLALSQKNGLYPMLLDTCGPECANALMDFANYSLLFRSDPAKDFSHQMADQMLFSEKLCSASRLLELFEKKITQSRQEDFKDRWAAACAKNGIKKVWLCIGGSNRDCTGQKAEPGKKGKEPPEKTTPVSYIMAVDAKTGLPVAERTDRGGALGSKAFIEIIGTLKRYSLEVEGVIASRRFCDIRCFETILGLKLPYILMLKENTSGFRSIHKKHADDIRTKSANGMGNGFYAVSEACRIFGKYDQASWVTLCYDSVSGQAEANDLFDRVSKCVDDSNEQAKSGHPVRFERALKPCILTVNEGPEITHYEINHEKLQEAMAQKGFSAIAADSDYGPKAVLEKADLLDQSEQAYMMIQTQMGRKGFRTRYTEGDRATGFVSFIASIVRQEFAGICRKTGYELTQAIREANFICVQRTPDNDYLGVHNAIGRQIELLAAAGLEENDIDFFASQESGRVNGEVHDQLHRMPIHEGEEKEAGGGKKRGPGRPGGSSKVRKDEKKPEEAKRGRGRPRGSKNKPKPVREPAAADPETKRKAGRGPGRPPGSKNVKPAVNAKAKRQAAKGQETV